MPKCPPLAKLFLRDLVNEMYVHGMSQRDVELALESALGQFVLSKSSVSQISESLLEDYEAFKQRDLSGFDAAAYLFIDAVYEPVATAWMQHRCALLLED